MTARPKTYAGTAKEFADPEASKKITEREISASKMLDWQGEEDVEAICNTFIEYLWSGSLTTLKALQSERLKNKIEMQEEEEDRRRKIEAQFAKQVKKAEKAARDAQKQPGQPPVGVKLDDHKKAEAPAL